MLYNPSSCPCLNVKCDLYQNCEACIKRHHASERFPLTACEICDKEGCDKANPAAFQSPA